MKRGVGIRIIAAMALLGLYGCQSPVGESIPTPSPSGTKSVSGPNPTQASGSLNPTVRTAPATTSIQLAVQPYWLSLDGTRLSFAAWDPATNRPLDVRSMAWPVGSLGIIGKPTFRGGQTMIGDVCAGAGYVAWLDQDHMQNEVTDPTAWKIVVLRLGDGQKTVISESNADSAFVPPVLRCDSQHIVWDEYAGKSARSTNLYVYDTQAEKKTEIAHQQGFGGVSVQGSVMAGTLISWPSADVYRTDIQLRTTAGSTALASDSGRAFGPRIGDGVVAWTENPVSGDRSIVARTYLPDLRFGPVFTIDPSGEDLLGVCGNWVVYQDSQTQTLAIANEHEIVKVGEAGTFFQAGGVACDSHRMFWASTGSGAKVSLNEYDLT